MHDTFLHPGPSIKLHLWAPTLAVLEGPCYLTATLHAGESTIYYVHQAKECEQQWRGASVVRTHIVQHAGLPAQQCPLTAATVWHEGFTAAQVGSSYTSDKDATSVDGATVCPPAQDCGSSVVLWKEGCHMEAERAASTP